MNFFKYRTCLQIFYFIQLNIISLNGEDNIQKVQEILNDLPKASDLEDYLLFLDRILDFYMKYKFYIDINSYSTLFIFGASVHQVLKNQRETLPSDLVFRLEKMFDKSKTLCDYYRAYIERGIKEHELQKSDINTVKISYLFHNVSSWIPFEKFNLELLKRTKIYDRDELETMYGPWERYAKSISSVKMCIPSEEQSDSCVGLLARQPTFLSIHTSLAKCNLPPYCRLYVQHGSDFGYGIMHRLLLLIHAKHSRNCVLFSEKEDNYLRDKLCSMVYNECRYIALSDFVVPDLLTEGIAFCGAIGHAHFLTNFWVKSLMMHQTADGCMMIDQGRGDDNFDREFVTDKYTITDDAEMLNGSCIKHMTALAIYVVSNVFRYIVETHY